MYHVIKYTYSWYCQFLNANYRNMIILNVWNLKNIFSNKQNQIDLDILIQSYRLKIFPSLNV